MPKVTKFGFAQYELISYLILKTKQRKAKVNEKQVRALTDMLR